MFIQSLVSYIYIYIYIYSKGRTHKLRSPMNPSHGRVSIGRSTKIYLQQLFTGTGCSLEDLPEVMYNKDEW